MAGVQLHFWLIRCWKLSSCRSGKDPTNCLTILSLLHGDITIPHVQAGPSIIFFNIPNRIHAHWIKELQIKRSVDGSGRKGISAIFIEGHSSTL